MAATGVGPQAPTMVLFYGTLMKQYFIFTIENKNTKEAGLEENEKINPNANVVDEQLADVVLVGKHEIDVYLNE